MTLVQTTRLYDATRNISKATFNHKAASLACCFEDENVGYGGGLDQMIHSLDLQRGTSKAVLAHDAAVSCMQWSSSIHALFTGKASILYTSCISRRMKSINSFIFLLEFQQAAGILRFQSTIHELRKVQPS